MKLKSFKRSFINKILQTADFSDYRSLQLVISNRGIVVSHNRYPENVNEKNSILK